MRIEKPGDLARIVKMQRQAYGLTQQEVADAVGITRQSLARIERGNGGVSFDTVLKIFAELDVHLDGKAESPADVSTRKATPLSAQLSARQEAFKLLGERQHTVAHQATYPAHIDRLTAQAIIEAGDPDRQESELSRTLKLQGNANG